MVINKASNSYLRNKTLPPSINSLIHKRVPASEKLKNILIRLNIINENGKLLSPIGDLPLDTLEINKKLDFLLKIKFEITSIGRSFTLLEIFEKLDVLAFDAQTPEVKLVGGTVLHLLTSKFFEQCLIDSLHVNTSLDPLLTLKLSSDPADIDIRFHLENHQIDLFQLEQLFHQILGNPELVQRQAYNKKMQVIDENSKTNFLILAPNTNPSVEFLFCKSLPRYELFTHTSLNMDLYTNRKACLKSSVSSQNPWKGVLHLLLMVIHARDIDSLNHLGFMMYISYLTRGFVCLDSKIEAQLFEKFLKFYLCKDAPFGAKFDKILFNVLTNHHQDPHAILYFSYNFLFIAKKYAQGEEFCKILDLIINAICHKQCQGKPSLVMNAFKEQFVDKTVPFDFFNQFFSVLSNDELVNKNPKLHVRSRVHCKKEMHFIQFKNDSVDHFFLCEPLKSINLELAVKFDALFQLFEIDPLANFQEHLPLHAVMQGLIKELTNDSIYTYDALLNALSEVLQQADHRMIENLFKIVPEICFSISDISFQKHFMAIIFEHLHTQENISKEQFVESFISKIPDYYQFKIEWIKKLISSDRLFNFNSGILLIKSLPSSVVADILPFILYKNFEEGFSLIQDIISISKHEKISFKLLNASFMFLKTYWKTCSSLQIEKTLHIAITFIEAFDPELEQNHIDLLELKQALCKFIFVIQKPFFELFRNTFNSLTDKFLEISGYQNNACLELRENLWAMLFSFSLKFNHCYADELWNYSVQNLLFIDRVNDASIQKLVLTYLEKVCLKRNDETTGKVIALILKSNFKDVQLKKFNTLITSDAKDHNVKLANLISRISKNSHFSVNDLNQIIQHLPNISSFLRPSLKNCLENVFEQLILNFEKDPVANMHLIYQLFSHPAIVDIYPLRKDFILKKGMLFLQLCLNQVDEKFKKFGASISLIILQEVHDLLKENALTYDFNEEIHQCLHFLDLSILSKNKKGSSEFFTFIPSILNCLARKEDRKTITYLMGILSELDQKDLIRSHSQLFEENFDIDEVFKMERHIILSLFFIADEVFQGRSILEEFIVKFVNELFEKTIQEYSLNDILKLYPILKKHHVLTNDLVKDALAFVQTTSNDLEMLKFVENMSEFFDFDSAFILELLKEFISKKKVSLASNLIHFFSSNEHIHENCDMSSLQIEILNSNLGINHKIQLLSSDLTFVPSSNYLKQLIIEVVKDNKLSAHLLLWNEMMHLLKLQKLPESIRLSSAVLRSFILKVCLNAQVAIEFLNDSCPPVFKLSCNKFTKKEMIQIYSVIVKTVVDSLSPKLYLQNDQIIKQMINFRFKLFNDDVIEDLAQLDITVIKKIRAIDEWETCDRIFEMQNGIFETCKEDLSYETFNIIVKKFMSSKLKDIPLQMGALEKCFISHYARNCNKLNAQEFILALDYLQNAHLNGMFVSSMMLDGFLNQSPHLTKNNKIKKYAVSTIASEIDKTFSVENADSFLIWNKYLDSIYKVCYPSAAEICFEVHRIIFEKVINYFNNKDVVEFEYFNYLFTMISYPSKEEYIISSFCELLELSKKLPDQNDFIKFNTYFCLLIFSQVEGFIKLKGLNIRLVFDETYADLTCYRNLKKEFFKSNVNGTGLFNLITELMTLYADHMMKLNLSAKAEPFKYVFLNYFLVCLSDVNLKKFNDVRVQKILNLYMEFSFKYDFDVEFEHTSFRNSCTGLLQIIFEKNAQLRAFCLPYSILYDIISYKNDFLKKQQNFQLVQQKLLDLTNWGTDHSIKQYLSIIKNRLPYFLKNEYFSQISHNILYFISNLDTTQVDLFNQIITILSEAKSSVKPSLTIDFNKLMAECVIMITQKAYDLLKPDPSAFKDLFLHQINPFVIKLQRTFFSKHLEKLEQDDLIRVLKVWYAYQSHLLTAGIGCVTNKSGVKLIIFNIRMFVLSVVDSEAIKDQKFVFESIKHIKSLAITFKPLVSEQEFQDLQEFLKRNLTTAFTV